MAGNVNYTYRNMVEDALLTLGVTSAEESVEGNEAAISLRILNELIDEWNASSGLLYTTLTQSIPLTGNQTYRIGPNGNFQGGVRPTEIISAWIRENGIDYQLTVLTDSDFDDIPQKNSSTSRPAYINFDRGAPDSLISLYPSGYGSGELFIRYLAPLSEVSYDTPVVLPPAYQAALRYNLAVKLAPIYGEIPAPQVELDARTSKAKIMSNNAEVPEMDFSELFRFKIGRRDFDIYSGY